MFQFFILVLILSALTAGAKFLDARAQRKLKNKRKVNHYVNK